MSSFKSCPRQYPLYTAVKWAAKILICTSLLAIFARRRTGYYGRHSENPFSFKKFSIMAQSGKASIKRGKPSYFMAILGVTLVLFLLCLVGWITINSKKLMEYFKESVQGQVFLQPNVKDTAVQTLQNQIAAQPLFLPNFCRGN